MKARILIVAAFGLALALYLVMYVGLGSVFSAAATVGWGGFSVLCLCALPLFPILGAAWCMLLPAPSSAWWRITTEARMVRDAAGEVLPFSQLGGFVLGARAALLRGLPQPLTYASMIVDVTNEMLAQIVYVALGVAILVFRTQKTTFMTSLTTGLIVGLALAMVAAGLLLALQRNWQWMSARITARPFPGAVEATAAVTAALSDIYGSRRRVAVSFALHFAAWIASALGAWVAFRLIGARVGFKSVLAIESLVCAARSTAFLIPSALGVQEAAYAILTPLFGVGAEVGLAVSLLKRAREVAVGVPILLLWQAEEGRRALAGPLPKQ